MRAIYYSTFHVPMPKPSLDQGYARKVTRAIELLTRLTAFVAPADDTAITCPTIFSHELSARRRRFRHI